MSPSPATGRLRVQIETPGPYVRQPINVIDGSTLQLVAAAACNEEIEVPVGTYFVSATLPTGDRRVAVAEVAPGELSELSLEVARSGREIPAPPAPPLLESLGPTAVELPAGVAEPAATSATWFVRFHVQAQAGRFRPADPQVDVTSLAKERAELTVSASGDGILLAQVARAGEVPLNVALPIFGPTSSQSCRLTLEGAGSSLDATVSLPDNAKIDAVGRYLHSGHLHEAASVGGDAEQLLQQKMADPFGAALGGYALLRSGQLDRLHHWPRNLADWFPWLPDGAVIAGEEAALEGDHAVAIHYVCEAAARGLPVFAPGLSLLAARLREYSGAPETAFGENGRLVAEAGRLLERLLAFMPFVDFARVSLAYRGGSVDDPAGSQTPFSLPAEDGWHDVTAM